MGAIRSAIANFDQAENVANEQRELLEALAELAQTKADYFELEIQNSLTNAGSANKTIPIEAILDSRKETHAYSNTVVDTIATKVAENLRSFVSGGKANIVDGVAGLMSTTITAFLGAGGGTSDTMERYYVMTEGLSIVRVDLKAWYQKIESSALSNQVQKVSAFVAIKSAVDVSAMRFNTFLNVYQQQLAKAALQQEAIVEALDDAQEIYQRVRYTPQPEGFLPLNIRLTDE